MLDNRNIRNITRTLTGWAWLWFLLTHGAKRLGRSLVFAVCKVCGNDRFTFKPPVSPYAGEESLEPEEQRSGAPAFVRQPALRTLR